MKSGDKIAFTRSDLACERGGGKEHSERMRSSAGFTLTEVEIDGRFVTVDTGKIWLAGDARTAELATVLADELCNFIKSITDKQLEDQCILVAGLGNRFITADSLGPLVTDRITATRHMMGDGGIFDSIGCSKLCTVTPGVLGQTGIEAAAVIRGAAAEVMPDVVIAVDALAARSTARLATTVQISDTGIHPGSGIGNRRVGINRETVGCPVISIGVPTVVDSRTLIWDALEQAGVNEVSDSLRRVLNNEREFFVSPGDCDIIVREIAGIIADAIGIAAGM